MRVLRAKRRLENPPKPPKPCGTHAAAARHRANGDCKERPLREVCPSCADAERNYQRERRGSLAGLDPKTKAEILIKRKGDQALVEMSERGGKSEKQLLDERKARALKEMEQIPR